MTISSSCCFTTAATACSICNCCRSRSKLRRIAKFLELIRPIIDATRCSKHSTVVHALWDHVVVLHNLVQNIHNVRLIIATAGLLSHSLSPEQRLQLRQRLFRPIRSPAGVASGLELRMCEIVAAQ